MKRQITKDEFIAGVINNIKEDKGSVRQGAKSPYFLL